MKAQSLTILHYGKDYLPYAIRSVYDSVEKCHVFYTPTPSHGHQTDIPPVETREDLLQAAFSYDPDKKVVWYDMENVTHEGEQRDAALEVVRRSNANLCLVLDCDEIWKKDVLRRFLGYAWERNHNRNYLVNMIHFWRSFNYACHDDGWPVRIIDLRQTNREVTYLERGKGQVYHFGYAVRDEIMRYKWMIHGHKNELRENWLRDKWFNWQHHFVNDVHPTNDNNFWTPEQFDKEDLPEFMKDHPFYNLEIIR